MGLERPDLDLPPARLRGLGGERERHVEVGGLDDPEAAEVLVVSEAAVRKHVGNIFAKLALDPASDRRVTAVLTYLRG